jgi:hypothetical protein
MSGTPASQRLEPSRAWRPLSLEEHKAFERQDEDWYKDRHVEKAPRGYKLAQEVVDRHKGHALACAAYATELEWFVAEEGSFVIPPHLAFSRWMALGHDIDGKVLYRLKFNDIERTT